MRSAAFMYDAGLDTLEMKAQACYTNNLIGAESSLYARRLRKGRLMKKLRRVPAADKSCSMGYCKAFLSVSPRSLCVQTGA